jgi:hypothetical protein
MYIITATKGFHAGIQNSGARNQKKNEGFAFVLGSKI